MGKRFTEEMARSLIECFSKRQQGGHFACPRCGRMAMNENSVHNALSRRIDVYVCDACGMQEALEDMADSRTPLEAWAIFRAPALWNPEAKRFTKREWAEKERMTPGYIGRWEATRLNIDRVEAGDLPADYIGRRNMLSYEPGKGTVLLTEGYHFIIDDEEGRNLK